MADEPERAPHFDAYFLLMIVEMGNQVEWAVEAGRELFSDAADDPWSKLQSFAMHTALVGAFVSELASRKKSFREKFPDRGEMLRLFFSVDHNFESAKAIRDGMIHIDERIEERWVDLAVAPSAPPELLIRTWGRLGVGPSSMINWDPELRVVAFARRGGGYDELNVTETVEVLENLAGELTQFKAWMGRTGPAPKGIPKPMN